MFFQLQLNQISTSKKSIGASANACLEIFQLAHARLAQ